MEQEQTGMLVRLKRVLNSKWTVWAVAFAALILLCLSATVAFGFGVFSSAGPQPLLQEAAVQDNSPPHLTVAGPAEAAATASAGTATPGTQAAATLQSQDAATTPQSTVNEQAAAGASLSPSAVNLQAAAIPGVNPQTLHQLDLGL